eukprot:scaffold94997_cov54-Phaeocystis_antarctica.AAC.2
MRLKSGVRIHAAHFHSPVTDYIDVSSLRQSTLSATHPFSYYSTAISTAASWARHSWRGT